MITTNWENFLAKKEELDGRREQLKAIQNELEFTQGNLTKNQQELNVILEKAINLQSSLVRKSVQKEKIGENIHIAIDFALPVPENSLFIQGWLVNFGSRLKSITFQDSHGFRTQIHNSLVSTQRVDVYNYFLDNGVTLPNDRVGFFCLISNNVAKLIAPFNLIIELENNETKIISLTFPQNEENPLDRIKYLLSLIDPGAFRFEQQLNKHIGPVVYTLWKNNSVQNRAVEIFSYGHQPERPEISILVPLYGRIDFLQYQLSLLADDLDFQKNELIYILDDPRLENELFELCTQLSPLFEVPFKVIYTGSNFGYAIANNIAAQNSIGRYLLLLNSDVMPRENGWLTALKNLYESIENIGALAPTLLYEDESVQHAGMVPYKIPPYYHLWFNNHPGKGQPNFKKSSHPYRVPAVTGACLMVSRKLYVECGGLSEDYILGDFEDSDFCLKLLQKGLKNYCHSQVELYHLERQSQSLLGTPDWRQSLTLYNSWLYTQRWDSFLQKILLDDTGKISYE